MTKSNQLSDRETELKNEFLKAAKTYEEIKDDSCHYSLAVRDGAKVYRDECKKKWNEAKRALTVAKAVEADQILFTASLLNDELHDATKPDTRVACVVSDSYTIKIRPNGSGSAYPAKAAALARLIAQSQVAYRLLKEIGGSLDSLDWMSDGNPIRKGYALLWEKHGKAITAYLESADGRAI
jgi:hypothetical protein